MAADDTSLFHSMEAYLGGGCQPSHQEYLYPFVGRLPVLIAARFAADLPAWGVKRTRCSSSDAAEGDKASPLTAACERAAAGTADADSSSPASAFPAASADQTPAAADGAAGGIARRRTGTSRRVRRAPTRAAD